MGTQAVHSNFSHRILRQFWLWSLISQKIPGYGCWNFKLSALQLIINEWPPDISLSPALRNSRDWQEHKWGMSFEWRPQACAQYICTEMPEPPSSDHRLAHGVLLALCCVKCLPFELDQASWHSCLLMTQQICHLLDAEWAERALIESHIHLIALEAACMQPTNLSSRNFVVFGTCFFLFYRHAQDARW